MALATLVLMAATTLTAQTVAHTYGCARQLPDVQVSADGASLTVGLERDGMQINSAGSTSCKLDLDIAVPANRSFAVKRVTAHGLVNLLDPVESASVTADWLFDRIAAGEQVLTIQAPSQGIYDVGQDVADASLTWSPCGGAHRLSLFTRLISDELMTVDPNTMRMSFGYELEWKDCGFRE